MTAPRIAWHIDAVCGKFLNLPGFQFGVTTKQRDEESRVKLEKTPVRELAELPNMNLGALAQ
jgi:hypothetical protein